jgi:transposase InsO family protein
VSTAHPGERKTQAILVVRYFWPGMRQDIKTYVSNCKACRRATVPRDKTPGLLQSLPVPYRPWQHLSMDLKSFPSDKHGFDTICVFVDRLGKRPWSIPCTKTITAEGIARLFIDGPYRIYGPPESIVSDRGAQFISAFWTEFCRILGIKIKLSMAFYL